MLTAYDNNPEPTLTPEYGQLVFKYGEWGQNPDGSFFSNRTELATHYCTDEELGLLSDDENSTDDLSSNGEK